LLIQPHVELTYTAERWPSASRRASLRITLLVVAITGLLALIVSSPFLG